ncbi:MAG TPA: sigma 54-interacting transcriptional regulator, partial [Planctomycetota bacterium]|nr:sigma 54-interacting transcriptional regulator [Planctomycetota bacterium]
METDVAAARRARLTFRGPDGPLAFALTARALTIGRSPDCDIRFADPRVSRRHARIEPSPEGWRIVDLSSQNGILVNGVRATAAKLSPGDVVHVGGVRLEYSEGGEEAPRAPAVTRRAEEPSTSDGDAMSTQVVRPASAEDRFAQRLKRVGELMRTLGGDVGSDVFFEHLVAAAVDLTAAERGFVIVNGKEGPEFRAARNIGEGERKSPEFEISWSIAVKVGTTGEGVLSVDALSDPRFRAIESVENLGLRSILCVPIRSTSGIQGVLYLDNRLTRGAFTPDDRHAVEVLGDQAGVALEQERLARDLRRRREEVEDLNKKLRVKVDEQENELRRIKQMTTAVEDPDIGFRTLIGDSPRMDELRALLAKASPSDLPVLIFGESGVGKELVARCLHKNSPRRDAQLVSVNCASFPESLLENELFGHVRGAYTGADQARKGLFETAHKGTLFLDEIECMSPGMQSRLLRALQEGEIRPVGAQA